jgi:hypothetical protein
MHGRPWSMLQAGREVSSQLRPWMNRATFPSLHKHTAVAMCG